MQACFRDTLQSTVRAAAHCDTFEYGRGADDSGILNFASDAEAFFMSIRKEVLNDHR